MTTQLDSSYGCVNTAVSPHKSITARELPAWVTIMGALIRPRLLYRAVRVSGGVRLVATRTGDEDMTAIHEEETNNWEVLAGYCIYCGMILPLN